MVQTRFHLTASKSLDSKQTTVKLVHANKIEAASM
jgi:hypothetical protein